MRDLVRRAAIAGRICTRCEEVRVREELGPDLSIQAILDHAG